MKWVLPLVLVACAAQRPDLAYLRWRNDWPSQAADLCEFAMQSPTMADPLRNWARDHPLRMRDLLEWASNQKNTDASPAFLDWQVGPRSDYRPSRDPVMYALLRWAELNPEAAVELARTPQGVVRALDGLGCQ